MSLFRTRKRQLLRSVFIAIGEDNTGCKSLTQFESGCTDAS